MICTPRQVYLYNKNYQFKEDEVGGACSRNAGE
jgi:hypothetical protein